MTTTTPVTKGHVELAGDIVRELIHYSPETGVFTWKNRGRHWFSDAASWKKWNTKHAGKVAGYTATCSSGRKSRVMAMLGRQYGASRIAFLYMADYVPWHVDHRDRNSLNDKWSNLRESDPTRNQRNKNLQRTNTSGVTGVSWHKMAGKWRAEVTLNGKRRHLGLFKKDDLDIAAMEVMEFRAEHGFDPGHGLERADCYRDQ